MTEEERLDTAIEAGRRAADEITSAQLRETGNTVDFQIIARARARAIIASWEASASRPTLADLALSAPEELVRALTEVERLRAAVALAKGVFERYGDLHAAKPDDHKATANYLLAAQMDAALHGRTTDPTLTPQEQPR